MRALAVAILACLPLAAQMPRGAMNWWDTPFARNLNLNADQQRTIRETVRDYRSRLIDLRAETEKAEIAVEDAFNEENVDQKKASEAIERLATARADLIRTVTQMSLKMRMVLTADQWRRLQERRRREMEDRRGPGLNRPNRQGPGPGGANPPPPDPLE